jgi:hypothetical protein
MLPTTITPINILDGQTDLLALIWDSGVDSLCQFVCEISRTTEANFIKLGKVVDLSV